MEQQTSLCQVRSSCNSRKRSTACLALLACLLSFELSVNGHVTESDDAFEIHSCPGLISTFAKKYNSIKVDSHGKDAFVFFLHVPRTAGKTYSTCFLGPSLKPSKRCMPAYDYFRYPNSQEGCRYLVSHDDLSVLDNFPKDDAVVVTQLRDPVQRVISAYEFSIEVAGRKIHLSDKEFLKQKANTSAVNTFNVWPWSYLIPFSRNHMKYKMGMLEDDAAENGLESKWEEHFDTKTNRTFYYDKVTNTSYWVKPDPKIKLNPYNNALTMPLVEWIETDEASELVHNGATLQVLGITNTSFWPEASLLRKCFIRDSVSRESLLSLAKEKLKEIPHIGLQEHLDDSVASLAATLQVRWDDPAYKSLPLKAYFYDPPGTDLDKEIMYSSSDAGGKNVTITVRKARQIVHRMIFEGQEVRKKLKKLEPKLSKLVDQEEEWLDDQEEQQKRFWSRFKSFFVSIKDLTQRALSFSSDNEQENDKLLESSPFNAEILKLDDEVHELQQRDMVTRHEYHTLMRIPEVKGVEFNSTVKAFAPVLDEEHIDDKVLGDHYKDCAATAIRKGRAKRRKSFLHLRTPQDESFVFSSFSRKNISEKIISRIEELNKADLELYEMGKKLFRETIEEQKKTDTWKQFARGFEKKVQNLTTSRSDSTASSQDSTADSAPLPTKHTEL